MARGLKIWIREVERLYYLCSKTLDAVTVQLIFAVVLEYAKSRFSHEAVHISTTDMV